VCVSVSVSTFKPIGIRPIISKNEGSSVGCTAGVEGADRSIGLRISEEQTKYIKTTRNQGTLDKNIQLMEYEFPICESFKYLGDRQK
jgi:hypothetical protein